MNLWWSLVAFGLSQAITMFVQQKERDENFALATAAAARTGKPLLVVGGPWGNAGLRRALNWPNHGHGDVCLDLEPAACGEPHFVHGDVRKIPFPAGFFGAAFCSHVLEHLPTPEDCATAVAELHRVADEVFLCVPGRGTIIAWLAPEHHLWVDLREGDVSSQPMRPGRVTVPLA